MCFSSEMLFKLRKIWGKKKKQLPKEFAELHENLPKAVEWGWGG